MKRKRKKNETRMILINIGLDHILWSNTEELVQMGSFVVHVGGYRTLLG